MPKNNDGRQIKENQRLPAEMASVPSRGILIPPVLLVVADLLTQGKRAEIVNPIISINALAYEGYDLTTALQEIARIGAGHVEMGFTRGFTEGTDQILTSGKTGAELVKGIGSDFIKLNYNRKSQ